jgi:hypothetical protein
VDGAQALAGSTLGDQWKYRAEDDRIIVDIQDDLEAISSMPFSSCKASLGVIDPASTE